MIATASTLPSKRGIKEVKRDEGNAVPKEDEVLTPQDRLANLKALLQKPKVV